MGHEGSYSGGSQENTIGIHGIIRQHSTNPNWNDWRRKMEARSKKAEDDREERIRQKAQRQLEIQRAEESKRANKQGLN